MSDEDMRREANKRTSHGFFGWVQCLDGVRHKIKDGCCTGCGCRLMAMGDHAEDGL